jgi:hypothetical protein
MITIIDKAVQRYVKYRDPIWLREMAEALVDGDYRQNRVVVKRREGSWAQGVFADVGVSHNLRTNVGIDYVAQQLGNAGASASATNIARWMALGNSDIAVAATHQSLGTNTAAVTTNEWTTNGLARAQATPAHTAGVANYTLTQTFTVSGGTSTVYFVGEFDRSGTASQILFLESDITDTTLNVNDQLQITHTVNI